MTTKTYQVEGGTIAIITPGDNGEDGQTIHHFFLNCEAMKAGDGETLIFSEVNCPDCLAQLRAIDGFCRQANDRRPDTLAD